jgi:ABC-type lipoprotein release transport system permease subunit
MGASKRLIRRIFFTEGMLIALIGCLAGLLLGAVFCVFQQKTGWIKMDEGSSLLISAYPVSLNWTDFIWVVLTVISISAIASAISSSLSVKNLNRLKEEL